MATSTAASKIKAVLNQQADAINRHDARAFASSHSPNAVVVDPLYPEPLRGTDAIVKDFVDFFTAFPDLKFTLRQTLVEGDSYAIEYTLSGTHTGPLVAPSGQIPATNRRIEVPGSAFGRVNAEGHTIEERRYYDYAGVLVQLGLLE